jgi:DNA-binding NtrC family response regulator
MDMVRAAGIDYATSKPASPALSIVMDEDELRNVVAKSARMKNIVDFAYRVAKVDCPVLITGESGSGKEKIARLIQQESLRANGPFIAVNCAAIPESLIESELFGHVRGAFTGAIATRQGLFEAASGGTLFLDEIGELAPNIQVKLLRALQEQEIRRVGENKSRRIDVRILAATNRDLSNSDSRQPLRQDLYFRLKVVELRVPPLRERREDILPLAQVLIVKAAQQMKRRPPEIDSNVAERLQRYDWPGNVRELENVMEYICALTQGSRVEVSDLPEDIHHPARPFQHAANQARTLVEVEKEYILKVLDLNNGNRTHTALQLQIGSATLYRKLKGYGLVEDKVAMPKKPSEAMNSQ